MLVALSKIVRCDTDIPFAQCLVQLGTLIYPFVLSPVVCLDYEPRGELLELAAPIFYDRGLAGKLR